MGRPVFLQAFTVSQLNSITYPTMDSLVVLTRRTCPFRWIRVKAPAWGGNFCARGVVHGYAGIGSAQRKS